MINQREIKRNYNMSDANMLSKVSFVSNCITKDLAKFTLFAPKFNAQYIIDLEEAITDARESLQDVTTTAILAQKTDAVNKIMEHCRILIEKEKYFVKLAFADSPSLIYEFGNTGFMPSRCTADEMLRYMGVLTMANDKYTSQLIAAGYSVADIDEVRTAWQDLQDAVLAQEYYKGERVALTVQRIEKLNKAREMVADVCKVGKIVFSDNPAAQKNYIFFKSRSKTGTDTFEDTIDAGASKEVTESEITPSTHLEIKNTGKTELEFFLADYGIEHSDSLVLHPKEHKKLTADKLGTGSLLYVHNLSSLLQGSYRVLVS
jgi:hypothetical protein